ncbi:hypothetical protein J6590_026378 [Homalodisca vitripennis]|nr:hypothetical protein J6590_026378 [Homalodisca vitripennis]
MGKRQPPMISAGGEGRKCGVNGRDIATFRTLLPYCFPSLKCYSQGKKGKVQQQDEAEFEYITLLLYLHNSVENAAFSPSTITSTGTGCALSVSEAPLFARARGVLLDFPANKIRSVYVRYHQQSRASRQVSAALPWALNPVPITLLSTHVVLTQSCPYITLCVGVGNLGYFISLIQYSI